MINLSTKVLREKITAYAYAYSKGVRANGLRLGAVVRGVNEVKVGSNNSIRTRVRSRVERKPGRLGAVVIRSTIISRTYDGHWSKTDRSDLLAPLLDRPRGWSQVGPPPAVASANGIGLN